MSMIKGKIETDREIAPTEITFGKSPIHRGQSGKWVSNDPSVEVIETDLGTLMDEAINQGISRDYTPPQKASEMKLKDLTDDQLEYELKLRKNKKTLEEIDKLEERLKELKAQLR